MKTVTIWNDHVGLGESNEFAQVPRGTIFGVQLAATWGNAAGGAASTSRCEVSFDTTLSSQAVAGQLPNRLLAVLIGCLPAVGSTGEGSTNGNQWVPVKIPITFPQNLYLHCGTSQATAFIFAYAVLFIAEK